MSPPGRFTGKERDAETGLDYFGARYFSGAQGRSTSPDPRYFQATALVDPQRFNLYSYARNNPHKWVDPNGESLYLSGDTNWLTTNVLYTMAGGQEAFDEYFHIDNSEVVLNEGVDTSNLNAGQQLLLDQVNSTDNYLYFAGTTGDASALLFQGTTGKNGKLNQRGKDIANEFTCGGGRVTGCGVLVGTSCRMNAQQPADLTNGDPVFAVIAYNENAVLTQTGVGSAGEVAKAGIGQGIAPASLFVHESAENLAFRSQGNWDYPQAHNAAIRREGQIRQDLHTGGGWAGGEIRTTVPKK
jgi:RHS repeat-associated protein